MLSLSLSPFLINLSKLIKEASIQIASFPGRFVGGGKTYLKRARNGGRGGLEPRGSYLIYALLRARIDIYIYRIAESPAGRRSCDNE